MVADDFSGRRPGLSAAELEVTDLLERDRPRRALVLEGFDCDEELSKFGLNGDDANRSAARVEQSPSVSWYEVVQFAGDELGVGQSVRVVLMRQGTMVATLCLDSQGGNDRGRNCRGAPPLVPGGGCCQKWESIVGRCYTPGSGSHII